MNAELDRISNNLRGFSDQARGVGTQAAKVAFASPAAIEIDGTTYLPIAYLASQLAGQEEKHIQEIDYLTFG